MVNVFMLPSHPLDQGHNGTLGVACRCTNPSGTAALSPLQDKRYEITIYAPMIYTAPCVRFLMRADRLRGEVGGRGGVGAGNLEFCGPLRNITSR
jgi:hypothetical protein